MSYRFLAIAVILLCLSSCKSSRPLHCENSYDENYKGSVKVGDEYAIKNKTYTPKLEQHYDEVGMASWYGHAFHCKKTANGEIFDKNQLSAAHNTLPLPSVVKVTNLSNNRSVNVIINDRGPFTGNRIIDISEKAAISLGMKTQGIAKVRVQFLPEETNELMTKIPSKKKIYYKDKPKHKFEITIDEYKDQKTALMVMRKVSKFGKVHLLSHKNSYNVILIANSKASSDSLLKNLINIGYKNAKANIH